MPREAARAPAHSAARRSGTRRRKRPRESGALAQSGVQSRNWELRECRIGEIMRDCISVMMTFISLDIFFGHAIQTNCLLLPGFGLRSVTLRLTRPTRPSARGERLTRPLPRNSARQSSAQPTAAARRTCSFRRRRQLPGGNLATFENNSTSLASAWTALIRPTDSAEPQTCCSCSSPTSATLATLSPPVAPALFLMKSRD